MKKIILTLTASSLLATSFLPLAVSASSFDKSSDKIISEEVSGINQEKYDSFLAEIKPYIYKSIQGTIEIGEHPEDISYTYANEIKILNSHLTPLNQQVLDGTLSVTEDLAFVSNSKFRAAATNGVTIYWWGYQYVFNRAGGLNFANGMEDLGFGSLSAAAFASMFGLGSIAGPLGAISGSYYKQLAKKIRQNTTSKGVIVNITHVAVFTVTPR